ncbi:MAG TPA: methyltransferase domain-containing protein, partial [Planctomycetaceae bacterium]
DYERAFAVFLAHTDQKDKARTWLDAALAALPSRGLFIDAGAGTGKVTAWFVPQFERTIAIEPNPFLREPLVKNCPEAQIIPAPILECGRLPAADFVLASHVFYYIPAADWQVNLDRLASFLGPAGTLVVVLQNAGSDCMGLVDRFHGRRFDLSVPCHEFQSRHQGAYRCRIDTVESHIETADFATAYTVAEFMLNLLPFREPPLRSDVEEYVRQRFATSAGGFRFSCSQDFLVITRVSHP